MGALKAGQVVLVHFPFSDLTQTKIRPAVVLAYTGRDDWILCQITSNPYGDTRSIALTAHDFSQGGLRVKSYARPGKLFTANQSLIANTAGQLNRVAINDLLRAVIKLLQENLAQ